MSQKDAVKSVARNSAGDRLEYVGTSVRGKHGPAWQAQGQLGTLSQEKIRGRRNKHNTTTPREGPSRSSKREAGEPTA